MLNPAEGRRLCVVLVSTRNPLNIGAAARAMQNFGFQRLRVVTPYDAAFREARSAVGASSVLASAEEFKSVAEAVADCTLVVGSTALGHRHLQHPVMSLQDGAPMVLQELSGEESHSCRVAILFGSEKFGLSNADLSHCHWLMHVPTGEDQPSMNLGQAVAVCLYELVRGTDAAPHAEPPASAASGDMERVTMALLDALNTSGYMDTRPAADKLETVRRLVRRLNLSAEDAAMWLGMLRQIAWKMRTKD